MSRRLRAAIVGLGVGEQHIAGYRAHPACEVVALCDLDPAKRAMARERYPELTVTESADALLTDPAIDLVSIASYDDAHAAQAVAALDHGKHVFVEKPLCLYPAEARAIRQALNAHPGRLLSSNLILRRSPRFVWLKEQLALGTFGQPYYAEADYNYGRVWKLTEGWRGKLDFYSVYYGGGVHMVDLLLWLLGTRVAEVSAFGNRVCTRESQFRHDDLIASLLRFADGTVAKVTANFGCVQPHFHGLALYGTEATFINRPEGGLLYRSREPDSRPKIVDLPYPGYHKGQFLYRFVEAALQQGEPEVSADEVFAAMSVCFAVDAAAREKAVVPVEYL